MPLPSPPPPPGLFASLHSVAHWLGIRLDRMEVLMSDMHAQLQAAEQALDAAVTAAAQRVNGKLDALAQKVTDLQTQLQNATGQQIDLTGDIADIQTEVSALNALAADPQPAPEPTTNPPAPPAP